MYEDSWYSFLPETQARRDGENTQKSGHRRRESLLKQPNESNHVDAAQPALLDSLFEESSMRQGPPKATLAKRAKSYADFYHVVRAHLRREAALEKERIKREDVVMDKLDGSLAFEGRYEALESDLLDASQEQYRLYRDQLALSERHLDNILNETSSALETLSELSDAFKTVEAQTTAFQAQCEDLLQEQKRIRDLADEVGTDLQYYSYLEPITRRLNAPGASRVIGDESFVEMLTNLDACIEFMISHPQHRESETYLTRYKSLLARTLNLIQIKFSNTLRDRTVEASNRSKEGKLNMTTVYLIQAPDTPITGNYLEETMRRIIEQASIAFPPTHMRSRVLNSKESHAHLETYHTLFRNMLNEYVDSRTTLILPIVQALVTDVIKEAVNPETDFPQYARASIQAVLDVCSNEQAKYVLTFINREGLMDVTHVHSAAFEEFWSHAGPFRNFLNRICGETFFILDTHLQRLDIPTAVDLVIWLDNISSNASSKLDDDPGIGSNADALTRSRQVSSETQVKASQASLIKAHIVNTIFSRMKQILLKDVEHYSPTTEDLNPKSILVKNSDSTLEPAAETKDADGELVDHKDVAARAQKALGSGLQTAYTPVKTAINLLIFHNDLTFDTQGTTNQSNTMSDEMAYEIMHGACAAVMRYETQLSKKSQIAGKLAAIKNLVLLKNLILAYEISGSRQVATLDFSRMLNTFSELQSRGSLFDLGAYYRLISSGELLPQVITSIKDARTELDGLLREMINQFRELSANKLRDPKSKVPGTGSWKVKNELVDLIAQYFEHESQLRENLWAAVEETLEARKGGRG